MRYVFPAVSQCGLGNNIITLAKAHRIAEVCRMRYLSPVWPRTEHVPDPRGYGRYFPPPWGDWFRIQTFSFLARVQRKTGLRLGPRVLGFHDKELGPAGVDDVGEVCLAQLRALGLDDPATSAVVRTTGMGGYKGIRKARPWLMQLLLSHADTRRRLEELEARAAGKLRVVVQVRMRDFAAPTGQFNPGERVVRIPLDWYVRVCRAIREVCDCEFLLVTDGQREELAPFLEAVRPIHYLGQPFACLLGLLLMARADLVVCSNSTYSRFGCFLNDRPYIWLADVLVPDDSGRFGYLWKERGDPPVDTGGNGEVVRRCFALPYGFAELPPGLKRYLGTGATLPIENTTDLLYGQAVPLPSSWTAAAAF